MTPFKALTTPRQRPAAKAAEAYLTLAKDIGASLESMRVDAGVSVSKMADVLGVTVEDVLRLESGNPEHSPSLIQIAAYSIVCGAQLSVSYTSAEKPGALAFSRKLWGGWVDGESSPTLSIQMGPSATPEAFILKNFTDKH